MNYKTRFLVLSVIVIVALGPLFALTGAAVQSQDDGLTYSPVIMLPPQHFNDCASNTGSNASIGIPADVTINGDLELAIDDEIAVFTPDGSICGGMKLWDGDNTGIAVWEDNTVTEEVDGFQAGQEMTFIIWDRSENVEIPVTEVTYSLGDGLYAPNSFQVVSAFTIE